MSGELVDKRRGHNWPALREEFINQNLVPGRPSPFTLRQLAEAHGVSYNNLRQRAGHEGWYELLRKEQKELGAKTKDVVDKSRVFNEVEVRVRQATYGKLAQSKAVIRLNNLDPNALTVREACDLLRLGVEIERKALGMPDTFVFRKEQELVDSFTPSHAREVMRDLLEIVRGNVSALANLDAAEEEGAGVDENLNQPDDGVRH